MLPQRDFQVTTQRVSDPAHAFQNDDHERPTFKKRKTDMSGEVISGENVPSLTDWVWNKSRAWERNVMKDECKMPGNINIIFLYKLNTDEFFLFETENLSLCVVLWKYKFVSVKLKKTKSFYFNKRMKTNSCSVKTVVCNSDKTKWVFQSESRCVDGWFASWWRDGKYCCHCLCIGTKARRSGSHGSVQAATYRCSETRWCSRGPLSS